MPMSISTTMSEYRASGSTKKLVGQILSIVWQITKTGKATYSKNHKNWQGSCPTCPIGSASPGVSRF